MSYLRCLTGGNAASICARRQFRFPQVVWGFLSSHWHKEPPKCIGNYLGPYSNEPKTPKPGHTGFRAVPAPTRTPRVRREDAAVSGRQQTSRNTARAAPTGCAKKIEKRFYRD